MWSHVRGLDGRCAGDREYKHCNPATHEVLQIGQGSALLQCGDSDGGSWPNNG